MLQNIDYSIIVIDDTYNSCFESVITFLEDSNNMSSYRKIGFGANGKDDTSRVHEQVKDLKFDYLYLIGDYTKPIYRSLKIFFLTKYKKIQR